MRVDKKVGKRRVHYLLMLLTSCHEKLQMRDDSRRSMRNVPQSRDHAARHSSRDQPTVYYESPTPAKVSESIVENSLRGDKYAKRTVDINIVKFLFNWRFSRSYSRFLTISSSG